MRDHDKWNAAMDEFRQPPPQNTIRPGESPATTLTSIPRINTLKTSEGARLKMIPVVYTVCLVLSSPISRVAAANLSSCPLSWYTLRPVPIDLCVGCALFSSLAQVSQRRAQPFRAQYQNLGHRPVGTRASCRWRANARM